jgi:fluoroquinolone transport system permease protein
MRLLASLRYDITFQFRHGFYYAYIFVSVLYILILRNLPAGVRPTVTTLVIFSDTGVLGFFFIGGIILLEKAQNTLENLFVTPLRLGEYFTAKVISLTLIAFLMSSVIMVFGNGIPPFPVPFILGVLFSSVFHTLLGFIISAGVKTLNEYFVSAMVCTFLVGLPVVDFLGFFRSALFYFFPTKASLLLIHGAFQSVPFPGYIYAVLCLLIWSVLAFIWAHRRFTSYVILKTGGRR